jgi:sigma-B regulation protein RsbU (phosphoserine phosphatase)
VRRLTPVLELLGTLTRSRLRLWHANRERLQLACGDDPGWSVEPPRGEGPVITPDGTSWFTPVPDHEGLWLEVQGDGGRMAPRAALAAPLLERLLSSERDAARLWDELTTRYAEIDLLYAISEILGHTVRLEEAAKTILRQVSRVVGARRASIMVFDETTGVLRVVAAQGFDRALASPVPVEDPTSVAARVFREHRVVAGDAQQPGGRGRGRHPTYRGDAFLSVPISYAAPGSAVRCIGVINLTDSLHGDRFSPRDRKLMTAVASQIGAAIENARLATREREQQRLQDELDLAHAIQLKLMPEPAVLHGAAEVAVRCLPAASVGGDFYTFLRLGPGRVGVMLGDVSSHGMSAALVMALVLSAAGIHTAGTTDPAETLRLLRESLVAKLSSTEMFVSVFYGVVDRAPGTLRYANAGHPHAYRVRKDGATERLEATAPPLGLGAGAPLAERDLAWDSGDLLVLWTDGLVDAAPAAGGERFGEPRLLERLVTLRERPAETIVTTIMEELDRHAPAPEDDRTLLVLRL